MCEPWIKSKLFNFVLPFEIYFLRNKIKVTCDRAASCKNIGKVFSILVFWYTLPRLLLCPVSWARLSGTPCWCNYRRLPSRALSCSWGYAHVRRDCSTSVVGTSLSAAKRTSCHKNLACKPCGWKRKVYENGKYKGFDFGTKWTSTWQKTSTAFSSEKSPTIIRASLS